MKIIWEPTFSKVMGWWIGVILYNSNEKQIRLGVGLDGWYFVLRWGEERDAFSGEWFHKEEA